MTHDSEMKRDYYSGFSSFFFQVHTKIVPNADFTTFSQNCEAVAFEPGNLTTVVGASKMFKILCYFRTFHITCEIRI